MVKGNYALSPVVEFCIDCKKNRVTDHHVRCNSCWVKYQKIKNSQKKTTK